MTLTTADAAQVIIDQVRSTNGGTSFVEVNRALEKAGMTVAGDYAIDLGQNLVAWADVSEEYVAAVRAALDTGQIHMRPTIALVYAIDGRILNMPVAQKVPKGGYKEPHWLPVSLNLGPHPDARRSAR